MKKRTFSLSQMSKVKLISISGTPAFRPLQGMIVSAELQCFPLIPASDAKNLQKNFCTI